MAQNKITTLSIKDLVADPDQPRQEFEVEALLRLEKSIRRQGVLVPLAVEKRNGKYIIVDGERRYRASTTVGLKELPVIIYETMDDQERLITRFHLQEQHSMWTALDKARVLSAMLVQTEMPSNDLADLVGMNHSTVRAYVSLLELSSKTREIANKNRIQYRYLTLIATTCRKVDDTLLRRKLEEALAIKVADRVVIRASDLSKYSMAITKGGDKIVKAIISNPLLSPDQAVDLAEAKAELSLRKITSYVGWLSNNLQKGMEDGSPQLITDVEEKALRGLANKLNEFVDKAGFVMPIKEEQKRAKVVRN